MGSKNRLNSEEFRRFLFIVRAKTLSYIFVDHFCAVYIMKAAKGEIHL